MPRWASPFGALSLVLVLACIPARIETRPEGGNIRTAGPWSLTFVAPDTGTEASRHRGLGRHALQSSSTTKCPVALNQANLNQVAAICKNNTNQPVCCPAICTTDFGAGPLSQYWLSRTYYGDTNCHSAISSAINNGGIIDTPFSTCSPKCLAFNASAPFVTTDATSTAAVCRVLIDTSNMKAVGDACKLDPSQAGCCKAICTTDFGRLPYSAYPAGANYGGQEACTSELETRLSLIGSVSVMTSDTCFGKCSLFNASAPPPPPAFATSSTAPCLVLFNETAIQPVKNKCTANPDQDVCCEAICTTDYGAGPLSAYWNIKGNVYNNQVSCNSELNGFFGNELFSSLLLCKAKCRVFNSTGLATPLPPAASDTPCFTLFNNTAISQVAATCQADPSQTNCCPAICETDFAAGPLSAYWTTDHYNNQPSCDTELSTLFSRDLSSSSSFGIFNACAGKCQIFNSSATVPATYATSSSAPCLVLLNSSTLTQVSNTCKVSGSSPSCCTAVCSSDYGNGAFSDFSPGNYNGQSSCNSEIQSALQTLSSSSAQILSYSTCISQCPSRNGTSRGSATPVITSTPTITPTPTRTLPPTTTPTSTPTSSLPSPSLTPTSSLSSPTPILSQSSPGTADTRNGTGGVPSQGGSNTGVIVGVSVGVVIVVVALVLGLLLCRKRIKKGSQQSLVNSGPPVSGGYWSQGSSKASPNQALTYGPVKAFTYAELQQFTNNFCQANFIGKGAFGEVFSGVLPSGKLVAVKCLSGGALEAEASFLAEVESIGRVHHKCLVSLIGYCAFGSSRMLLFDYVPNGNLHQHLHDSAFSVLSWPVRIKVAQQVASGLAYLHSECNPPIVHLDVKAANVLLDNNMNARVADFGLARHYHEGFDETASKVPGTPGYCDPEAVRTYQLTDRCDIYSFGVLLMELISGRKPLGPPSEGPLVPWAERLVQAGRQEELVDPRLQGAYQVDELSQVCALAVACLGFPGLQRPSMRQVARSLEEIVGRQHPPLPSLVNHSGDLYGNAYESGLSQEQSFSVPEPLYCRGSLYSDVNPLSYNGSQVGPSWSRRNDGPLSLMHPEPFVEPR